MLTNIKPNSEINKHVYRLTPQIIHQIFVEYPAVRDVYEEHVPHKLSEREFWERYFQSSYFHRIREQNSSFRSHRTFRTTSCDDIFMRCESITEDLVPTIKFSDIDHAVDLTFEEDDDHNPDSGFGVPIDERMDKDELEKAINVIRRFNRHSVLVLDNPPPSAPVEQTKKKSKGNLAHIIGAKRPREMTEDERNKKRLCSSIVDQSILDDLQNTKKLETVPLRITDQRRYFQSSASDAMDISVCSQSFLFPFLEMFLHFCFYLKNKLHLIFLSNYLFFFCFIRILMKIIKNLLNHWMYGMKLLKMYVLFKYIYCMIIFFF